MRQAVRAAERPSVGAMAGALGFALGNGPWIGVGRARLVAQDVRTASYLYAVAALLHLGTSYLDVHVLRLRRRLAQVGLAIRTVRSRGYLLEPTMRELAREA